MSLFWSSNLFGGGGSCLNFVELGSCAQPVKCLLNIKVFFNQILCVYYIWPGPVAKPANILNISIPM